MAKKLLCLLLAFICIVLCSCVKSLELSDYIKSCVQLVITDNVYATGFIANAEGCILTSAHSFKDCYQQQDISIQAQIDGDTYELELIAIDWVKDIALLKGDIEVSESIDYDSQSGNKCDYAYVLGNAYGENIISSKVQITKINIDICTETKQYLGALLYGDIALGCSGAPVIGTDGCFYGMVIGKSAHNNTIYALSPTEIKTFLEANI